MPLLGMLLALGSGPAAASDTLHPQLVIVVRHAEKADDGRDPSLSPAGLARSRALESALAEAGVETVITTPYRRTMETAAPAAARAGVTPVTVAIGGGVAEHAREVAAAAVRAGGVVLVVGHSNTVGPIVTALGGKPPVDNLCEAIYDRMYLVIRGPDGVRTVHSTYGAATPPDGSCQGLAPRR